MPNLYGNINKEVYRFYKKLPFNTYGNLNIAVKNIKNLNFKEFSLNLDDFINKSEIIYDVGCGGGWLSNAINYHYSKKVIGIDFNELALKHAREVAKKLKTNNIYLKKNILSWQPKKKFDLMISMGVLHHIKNGLGVLDRLCKYGNENSRICLGLYHKYGRQPFLDHFSKNKKKKNELFQEYKKIHTLSDSKHLKSWFLDQVMHPYEEQYLLKEVLAVLNKKNYKFLSTSINNFKKEPLKEIYIKEKKLYNYSLQKLKENKYYPGFFLIFAEKKHGSKK